MAITRIFQRYSFSDPHLNTVFHDYKRGINDLIDYFLDSDIGNLRLYDTDKSDLLDIKWNEAESNPYTLNLKVNSGNRTIDLSGNLTIESASIINQDLSSDASWTSAGLTATSASATAILLQSTGAADPIFTWKTTNTAHEVDVFLDESATNDILMWKGRTAGVASQFHFHSVDGQQLDVRVYSGEVNYGVLRYTSADALVLRNTKQDADLKLTINDGGVTKTITWDADVDILKHSAGTFNFHDDNIVSTGNYGIGISAWGTNAAKVLGIGGSTAPTTSPANMVQLWSADRSAGSANLYYRAEGGQARPLGREFDVSDYGLIPDDNSGSVPGDNVTAFDTLIGKMAAGDVMYFPRGVWYINDDLDVTQAGIAIRGDGRGSEIQQEVTEKMGFDITVSDITIRDLKLYGVNADTTYVSGANAIYAHGANSSSYISNIKVMDCFFENWETYGIYSKYIEQFEFRGNNIKTITYAGIMGLSVQDGHIHHNYIEDIKCPEVDTDVYNGYGIALSRLGAQELADQPRSARILVDHNIIRDVTLWEGLDSHSGEQITFDSNQIYDCFYGIIVTGSTLVDTVTQVIARDINIINNLCDATGLTVGAAGGGIVLSNANTPGVTGTIIGNVIKDHGYESNVVTTPSGALQVYYGSGVVIQGNQIFNPSPCGIVIMHTTTGFVCSGNTISNPWTDTADNGNGHARGIYVGGTGNTGYIGENTIIRGTDLSKTYELDTAAADDGRAIEIANSAGNVITLGANYSEATTYLTDAGIKAANPQEQASDFLMANNATIKFRDVGGTYQAIMSLSSTDDLEIGTGANVDDIRLAKNTKVGANTAPAAALDVAGNIIANSDTAKIALHNAAGTERAFFYYDESGGIAYIDSDSDIRLRPANTLAMVIEASGDVGIGCVPAANTKLDVDGIIEMSMDLGVFYFSQSYTDYGMIGCGSQTVTGAAATDLGINAVNNMYFGISNVNKMKIAAGAVTVADCLTDGTCEIMKNKDAINIISDVLNMGTGKFNEYELEKWDMKKAYQKYPFLVYKDKDKYFDKLGAKGDLAYAAILQLNKKIETLEKEIRLLKE